MESIDYNVKLRHSPIYLFVHSVGHSVSQSFITLAFFFHQGFLHTWYYEIRVCIRSIDLLVLCVVRIITTSNQISNIHPPIEDIWMLLLLVLLCFSLILVSSIFSVMVARKSIRIKNKNPYFHEYLRRLNLNTGNLVSERGGQTER